MYWKHRKRASEELSMAHFIWINRIIHAMSVFEKREVRRNCNRHCVLSSCANAVQARCQLTFTYYWARKLLLSAVTTTTSLQADSAGHEDPDSSLNTPQSSVARLGCLDCSSFGTMGADKYLRSYFGSRKHLTSSFDTTNHVCIVFIAKHYDVYQWFDFWNVFLIDKNTGDICETCGFDAVQKWTHLVDHQQCCKI